MANAALAKFEIKKDGDGYALHIEDDGGEKIELTATAEQLDVISESLIELLEADDASDAAEDDDADED